jgi:hypothetical protein
LSGTASQSSVVAGAFPNRAIDGNTGGMSITHTENEINPWWKVDLNGVFYIENIVIWNRADCCKERLSNANVDIIGVDGGTISTFNIGDSTGKTRIELGVGVYGASESTVNECGLLASFRSASLWW